MVRLLLTELLLFALPFIGYGVYLIVTRRAVNSGEEWRKGPLLWLVFGGIASMGAGLVWLALQNDEASRTGRYVPAHMENGVLVPGQFVPEK